MKDGPTFAPLAALAGDPARANMLAALMSGVSLTAGELAVEAGVTLSTASAHLSKLKRGGLLVVEAQGRHRYFRLADGGVAEMLERMLEVAAQAGHTRSRPGPTDPQLRKARVCYDHLAGEMGVTLLDNLLRRRLILAEGKTLRLMPNGARFARDFGIDVAALAAARRPVCRACLDWSERRPHLAGSLGAALLARMLALKWARRQAGGRSLLFTKDGERQFQIFLKGTSR